MGSFTCKAFPTNEFYGDKGNGDIDKGHGDIDKGHGDIDKGHGDIDKGHGDIDKGHGDGDKGHGDGDSDKGNVGGARDDDYGDRGGGYGDRDNRYGDRSYILGEGRGYMVMIVALCLFKISISCIHTFSVQTTIISKQSPHNCFPFILCILHDIKLCSMHNAFYKFISKCNF